MSLLRSQCLQQLLSFISCDVMTSEAVAVADAGGDGLLTTGGASVVVVGGGSGLGTTGGATGITCTGAPEVVVDDSSLLPVLEAPGVFF